MKVIYTLLLAFCFTSLVSAQQTKRSFAAKKDMTWLNEEVSTFDSTLKRIQKAHNSSDDALVADYRRKTITGINRFSDNIAIILDQIQDFIDRDHSDATKVYISDEPRDMSYYHASRSMLHQEIVLFDELKIPKTPIDQQNLPIMFSLFLL